MTGTEKGARERRAAPQLKCPDCGSTEIEVDPARGDAACVECGTVLEENAIVAEVTFQEDARGKSSVVGQRVGPDGKSTGQALGMPGFTREPTEVTMTHARHSVRRLVSRLRLSNSHAESALIWFRLCVQHNFHKGRKTDHVACACLYTACRVEKTPHMLIDFSDALHTNIFALGNTYLKLSRHEQILLPSVPVIDPSLYIYRFASKLEFGDMTHAVAVTALRLVARMKRDWISHGRRPSGLCGAALIVSARMHNFYRSLSDIVRVVRVGVAAIRDRLMEFDRTTARELTIGDIEEGGGEDGKINSLRDNDGFQAADPPAFSRAKALTERECLASGAEALAGEVRRVLQDPDLGEIMREGAARNQTDDVGGVEGHGEVQGSFAGKRQREDARVEIPSKESLSDIDDDEVDGYLNTADEVRVKEGVWTSVHSEYIAEQEQLAKLREEDPEQYKRLKPWRTRKGRKSGGEAGAGEAGAGLADGPREKRQSSKVNYAVLDDLLSGHS